MPYKNAEKQKACVRGYHTSNREGRLAYMKERRLLIKEGLFEKKKTEGFVRKEDKGLFEKKKTKDVAVEVVDLKPGDKGYVDVTPYLLIEPPVDGLSKEAAPPSVEEKKKPGMKVEPQDEEAEKMSDDLNEVFDE